MSDFNDKSNLINMLSDSDENKVKSFFCVSDDGLNDEQVVINRDLHGDNNLLGNENDTIFYRLRRAFVNPFSIILFVLAIVSLLVEVFMKDEGEIDLSTFIIISCMLVLSGTVRFVQELRSKSISDKLLDMIDSKNLVKRNNEWIEISSKDIVAGDLLALRAGDRVPADVRIIKANDLFVSQSMLTGESAILEKNANVLEKERISSYSDYDNIAFTGSAIIGGTGEGIVIAVGTNTAFGSIKTNKSNSKSSFDKGASSIAFVLIKFICLLVPIVFFATGITKGNWGNSIIFALSVGVGLTPEMLPMVVNACLAKGAKSMENKKTIVKNLNAMQGFGSMDLICLDKTGTLTGDKIILEYYMDILGNESSKVLDVAYLNSTYHSGLNNHLDDAILKVEEMPGKEEHFENLLSTTKKLDEIPFDYDRKFVSILVEDKEEKRILVKGSIKEVTERCTKVEHKGKIYDIDDSKKTSIEAITGEMLEDGMKVLAVAYKLHDSNTLNKNDENDLILLGYLAFLDAPKTSSKVALETLKKLNVSTKIMSGDEEKITVSICNRLGIDVTNRLTGSMFESLTEEERLVYVEKCNVISELSPKQKAQIVKILRENGHTVGFLGDGMNDLPAIVEADVGISVDQASDVVKEASDVVLLKKDLNVLEEGILEGRKAFANTKKYIKITASSNFGNILSIVIASIFLPFLPMTSLQLLLLNLLYDILCLILPWDSVDDDIYLLPQEWSGKNLARFMLHFGPVSSIFDLITFAFLYFVLCPTLSNGNEELFISIFQTGWFIESMWTQVLILHMLRTKKIPFVQSKPAISVIVVTIIGLAAYTILALTPLGQLFGMTFISGWYILFLFGIVIAYMIFVSIIKIIYVRKYHELT